jgi:CBS domain-containing protein
MKVKEIMTRRVVSVSRTTSIAETARRMRDEKVGSVLVLEEGKLVGLITDRQITHTAIAEGLDPNKVEVQEYMTEDFVPLTPEMDLVKAAKLMQELAIRRLPVVERGKPVGILSVSDFAFFVKACIDCILVEGGVRVTRRKQK